MKAMRLIIVLGLALSIPVALAQEEKEDHSSHHPTQKTDTGGARPSSDDQDASKSAPVQESMKKIERLMQQIQEADDLAQKRQLLSEHLQALRDQMRLIRTQHASMNMSMNDDGKKEDGMKEGMIKKGGMMGGMMMMHKKVEQRLDMLERMMQQVIEREAAQESVEQH